MESNKENISLPLLSAYWCNGVSAKYEDRFRWSWDKVDETVDEIGNKARTLLVALAQTAPGETMASYFAAGPLEDYINLIAETKDHDEAAFISENTHLKPYLEYVWGDIDKLKPLAAKGDGSKIKFEEADLANDLTIFEPKVLMGFWCHTSVSAIVEEYENYSAQVRKALDNHRTTENAKRDLLVSAPDDKAKAYLEANIFLRQK